MVCFSFPFTPKNLVNIKSGWAGLRKEQLTAHPHSRPVDISFAPYRRSVLRDRRIRSDGPEDRHRSLQNDTSFFFYHFLSTQVEVSLRRTCVAILVAVAKCKLRDRRRNDVHVHVTYRVRHEGYVILTGDEIT
jgi:hypothetical protein